MLHVAIFVHRHDSFEETNYWLKPISECWRQSGVRVSVVNDLRVQVDADLAILHVNLTVTPPEYLAAVRRYPVAVNGGVSDISKRAVSSHLLRHDDHYEGPVIVKTDRNFKGKPERHFARKGLWALDRRYIVRNHLDYVVEGYRLARRRWRYGSIRAFWHYPIFDSMREVPDAVWEDSDLVVERFLPEMRNDHFCVRTWLFLGDKERHAIFYSHEPVIKSHNIIGYERLPEVPEELRQMRRDLKFDFGKFDYTMVDGRPILFDANLTPAIGRFPKERHLPLAQALAKGLDAFLETSRC